jgi:hypothetical protein
MLPTPQFKDLTSYLTWTMKSKEWNMFFGTSVDWLLTMASLVALSKIYDSLASYLVLYSKYEVVGSSTWKFGSFSRHLSIQNA